MQPETSNMEALATGFDTPEIHNDFYSDLLAVHNIAYQEQYPYLVAGDPKATGWVLDLSVTMPDLYSLLTRLLPIFKGERVAFCLAVDARTAVQLFSADLGYERLGKVISVFPRSDLQAAELANRLIAATQGLRGAAVPTDTYLGGAVYARYSVDNVIPFRYPSGIPWPFEGIKRPRNSQPKRFFQGRYLAVQVLKADVKGNVMKGIDVKNWWKMRFRECLGKEGKRDMSLDQAGRTIRDRLEWQFILQTRLKGIVPIPEPFAFFEEDANAYLWMEFIHGQDLQQYRAALAKDCCWWAMERVDQLAILQKLQESLRIVETLHERGYIHRDLTPVNFLVEPSGNLRLIDLELCWNKADFLNKPPFTYGTDGFMAPEQREAALPTVKEDIYALGVLMICLLPGLHPSRLQPDRTIDFTDKIDFFLQDKGLSQMISSCLDDNPNNRPSLYVIQTVIDSYANKIQGPRSKVHSGKPVDEQSIRQLLQSHLLSYRAGHLANHQGLWYSIDTDKPRYVANRSLETTVKPGLADGIAGVQFVLANLKEAGYNLHAIEQEIISGWDWVQHGHLNQPASLLAGLYEGSYGLAVSLAAGIRSGMVVQSPETQSFLEKLLQYPTEDLSLGNGISGWGMAVLYCRPLINQTLGNNILQYCIKALLTEQHADGSWSFPKAGNSKQRQTYTGLSYGVAGVAFFLLDYYNISKDEQVKQSVVRALDWLVKNSRQEEHTIYWPYHPKSAHTDPWMNLGNAGIIRVFLKAYEAIGVKAYKQVAEAALNRNPSYILSDGLSLINGISGLGMVYLHAYDVIENTTWKDRADHIAQVLLHTYGVIEQKKGVSWFTNHSSMQIPGFHLGNAGVAYFLLHYQRPQLLKTSFIF